MDSGQSHEQQFIDELCKVFEGGKFIYHMKIIDVFSFLFSNKRS